VSEQVSEKDAVDDGEGEKPQPKTPPGTKPLSADSLGALPPLPSIGTDKTAASQPGVGGSAARSAPAPDEPDGDAEDRARDEPSLVGQVLDDRYEVTRKLGAGAMGVVYEALHLRLQKRFAMKVIHRELAQVPEFIARFEREALACSRLDHPNTISVTDFGRAASGELFLVMEFVEGRSIEDLIREGPIPVGRTLETTRQVLLALQHAHAAGVIHRDIKPENIMRVESDDGAWQVKVLDFGIAKAPTTGPDGQLTQAGVVFGTPQYMAPEQAMSATVDARADLYAVGATLWRMLTGKPLFDGAGPVEILTSKLSKPPPSLEQVAPGVYSQRLVAFLERALKRKPTERFASADEMVAELTRVQADLGGGLAIKPRGGTLKRVLDLGDQLGRRAVDTYSEWYNCAGHEGHPTWKLRLSTLATTRRGGVAAGLTLLALLLLLGVPLLQLASIPEPTIAIPEPAAAVGEPSSKDPSWIRKILPTTGDTKPARPGPGATAPPSGVQKRVLRVRLLLEKGACTEASVDLKNLVHERPRLAEGHYLLGAAEFCRRRHQAALAAYAEAIKLDPRFKRDVRILEHAKALLGRRGMRERAVAFLGAHLGPTALPVLIDAAGHNRDLEARHLAVTMVAKQGAASKIDWVSSLGLDLAQLPTCEERCKVVERLHQLGDPRAIEALRKARDAMVRYRIFRRVWKNGCCRERIIAVIKELLEKQAG